jgi:ABC-type Mn2+/Zn2+ transport system ATPase subunit
MKNPEQNCPAIDIADAVVSYREDIALRGVTLSVKTGEFVGIVGPNGAGKTTLLTVVNGMGKLRQGRACVLGQSVTAVNGAALRKRVGYVAQALTIDPRMPLSVREVAMIGRYGRLGWLRRPGRRDWDIVDRLLETVGVSHLAGRPIGHLSGGELQRVTIARCLVQEPDIFLLDEPTASLDWKAKTDIMALVKQLHESQRLTTLFVTHDMSALPMACDRVILMKDGLIHGDGTPAAMLQNNRLADLYDLPPAEVVRRKEGAAFQ